jgi:hypothetical protein
MKRILLVALAATAVAAAAAAAATSSPTSRLLGLVGNVGPLHLARIDPATLRALGGARVNVGSGGCASRNGGEACWTVPPWALSPDGGLLAIARNDRFEARSLRLVDVSSLRVRTEVRLRGNPVGALAWFSRGRILAVQEVCCGAQRLVAVDVAKRRVTVGRRLGSIVQLATTRRELVSVLAPTRAIGVATLAVVDPRGSVRSVRLGRIAAGTLPRPGASYEFDRRLPALAVDPTGRRAYVVGEQLIADVDLARLAVSYHPLVERAPFAARFAAAVPTAQTKGGSGSSRTARWLGDGVLAVSGSAEQTLGDETHVLPFGLRLVDTRSWRTRTIDGEATGFVAAGDLLLATGWSTDSTRLGLAAYGLDSTPRFRLFEGEHAWVDQVYGGKAYVGIARTDGVQVPLRIVDLATGTFAGARGTPLPWLLLGRGGGWWG